MSDFERVYISLPCRNSAGRFFVFDYMYKLNNNIVD